jgi:hypothetical protein
LLLDGWRLGSLAKYPVLVHRKFPDIGRPERDRSLNKGSKLRASKIQREKYFRRIFN